MNNINLEDLEQHLGYKFLNRDLLIEALSHPSINNDTRDKKPNYERLEFLGDSVLSLVIAELIYKHNLGCNEGKLAKLKAHLVSRDVIVKIAKKIDFQHFIIMADGEKKSGGRENINNIVDAFEAVLGAIYLDGNMLTAKRVIGNFWQEYFYGGNILESADPKGDLQEWVQSHNFSLPIYETIASDGPAHAPTFEVKLTIAGFNSVIANGSSKKEATKKAAHTMLKLIKGE